MPKKIISALLVFFTLNFCAQNKDVFDVARKGTLAEMRSLCKSNLEIINSTNERKATPLILACYRGNVDVALFLIEKSSNINYASPEGTALMATVMSGKIQIMESLISHKADLNLTESKGKTALIYAVTYNINEMAKALIIAGADTTHKDNDGRADLDYAIFNKNNELITLLNKQTNP